MLKKIILLFAFVVSFLLSEGKPAYQIKVKINGLSDTVCYLGNYYGDKPYIKDTTLLDSKGIGVFSGENALPGGLYLIIFPSKKYFEIIIDKEQNFYLECDTTGLTEHIIIKGSNENTLFFDYLKFITKKQKETEPLKEQLSKLKEQDDSIKIIKEELNKIDEDVKNYKLAFIKKYPESFLSVIFNTSYELEIPEAPILPNGAKDSTFAYTYFKQHFFDHIDFSDERLLRTPGVFHNKLKQYFSSVVIQIPDSIIKEADMVVEKARKNKEVFKYVVWYLTNWSETSNIMGFDAIFVHMVEKYYMTNEAYWVNATNLEKINSRAKILKNLLIGTRAPNLTAQDTNNVFLTLYNVDATYTILYFWDPTCGHCQKELPKLVSYYDSIKTKNIEVFALCADNDVVRWKKYVKENKMKWINVMDIQNTTAYHTIYDISSTPVMYLLDKDKKIIAKKLSVDQLQAFIEWKLKKDEGKKE